MENLETYLYIFFAIIYIISRVLKAKSKKNQTQKPIANPQQQPSHQLPNSPSRPKGGFSFEDILKDFEKSLSGDQFEEEKDLQIEEMQAEKPVEVVEEKSNKYQKYRHKTLKEDGTEIIRKKANFELSENFKIKEEIAGKYAKMLREPDGVKDAVILSEIINPKYF